MSDLILAAWQFLWALPDWSLFWLTLIVELPRYVIGLQATACTALLLGEETRGPLVSPLPRVSLLLVGMNEAETVEACVRSLRQQTFNEFEIICVSDGSTDETFPIMRRLREEGLVEMAINLEQRGGKPAGINLAANIARGEIIIVTDCDCSFEPDAIEQLLRPMIDDPDVHGVCGNILARNWAHSITTSLQGIEYLVSISLGKSFSHILNQITCISGAFGAFRKSSWHAIGGQDPGGGEDLDYTMRLRQAGYKVVFSRQSICYTDVPDTLFALLRQRNRWERDAFWIRLRKHNGLFSAFSPRFNWRETIHQLDFLAFSVAPSVLFPFYLTWVIVTFGQYSFLVLFAIGLALSGLDVLIFFSALLTTGKLQYWRLIAFVPMYGVFQSYLMRADRLYAYVCEAIWSHSLKDNYTPQKVRDWDVWRRR